MAETPLPQDWHRLLERFSVALAGVQQTLTRASALEEAAGTTTLDTPSYHVQLGDAAQKAADLDGKTAAITAWVDTMESELRASEDLLRVLLTQTETVRQKLATWAGRAIG